MGEDTRNDRLSDVAGKLKSVKKKIEQANNSDKLNITFATWNIRHSSNPGNCKCVQ